MIRMQMMPESKFADNHFMIPDLCQDVAFRYFSSICPDVQKGRYGRCRSFCLSLKLFCIILVIKLFVKTVEDRSVLLYNVSADVIGGRSSELPLTPLGMEQASIAGMVLKNSGLHFSKIFCSTAVRACQTLDCMGLISTVEPQAVAYSDCVEELSQGEWEGQPSGEYIRRR